jgi:hypothetical protein
MVVELQEILLIDYFSASRLIIFINDRNTEIILEDEK